MAWRQDVVHPAPTAATSETQCPAPRPWALQGLPWPTRTWIGDRGYRPRIPDEDEDGPRMRLVDDHQLVEAERRNIPLVHGGSFCFDYSP